jgi:hypothetical protein
VDTFPTQVRRTTPFVAVAVLVAAALGLLSVPLVPGLARAATASFKQVSENEIKSGTVNTQTFKNANTAGNLIVVYVAWTNKSSVRIEDSNNNQYASVDLNPTTWGPSSNRSSQVFYAKDIAGGANTVKATFTSAISSSGWADVYIHEYASLDKVTPLDVSHVNIGTDALMSSGPVNTTNASDLIFGAGASSTLVSQPGTDFTSRSSKFGNRTEDRTVGATGSFEATANQDGAGNAWVMHMVAFKVDPNAADTTSPTTPTGLNQTPRSTNQIDLSWNPSTDDVGVTSYKVSRNGTEIAAPATSSYSDMGLAPLTTYSYKVSATDAAGNVSKSAEISATTLAPPTDTTMPTVALTAPTNDAVISGTIDVTATASDEKVGGVGGVAGVQFLLDGNPLKAEDAEAPYSISWNTSDVPSGVRSDGPHLLSARARDTANNVAVSAPVRVTVDTSAPTVAITSPTSNAPIADMVKVEVDAFDNVAVASVQILVDSVDRGAAMTTKPYALEFNSRTLSTGVHTFAARARDTAGNSIVSTPVTVTVANDTSRCGVTPGSAPTATILEPNPARAVVAGDMITLTGDGLDPDCGRPLPDSAFNWNIQVVDDLRTVSVNSLTGVRNGSFPVPAVGSTELSGFGDNTKIRVNLTVTNQQGQKATSFVDVTPRKVQLTFNTVPKGLTLYIDDKPQKTEFILDTFVGSKHKIEARKQTIDDLSYTFEGWLDKQAPVHDITATSDQTAYTATFTVLPSQPVPIRFKQQNYSTAKDKQTTISTTYTNAQSAKDTNVIAVGWRSDKGDVKITDTKGNAYEPAVPVTRGERNLSQAIYVANNIAPAAPGENTVNVTFSGAAFGADVRIAEYSGLDPNKPIDIFKSSSGSNNSANSGPVTTTTANTMLYAAGISWSNYGDATNDFTTRVHTQPKMGGLASTGTGIIADRTIDTIGTYEAAAPVTGGGTWLMQLVAFRTVS